MPGICLRTPALSSIVVSKRLLQATLYRKLFVVPEKEADFEHLIGNYLL